MELEKIRESLVVVAQNLQNVEVKGYMNLNHLLASMVGIQDLVKYIDEIKEMKNE